MASPSSPPSSFVPLLFLAIAIFNLFLVSAASDLLLGHKLVGGGGRRSLMSFKEKASGSNVTYECSPSGPCVPCHYSEKNDEKYRCSETGYRIPLKCVEIGAAADVGNSKNTQKGRSALESTIDKVRLNDMLHDAIEQTTLIKQRNLLEDSSKTEAGSEPYITYRSCIPAVNEEKLSVLGFEVIMLGLLLVSGSAIFIRRRTSVMPGAVRVPTNSRF